MRDSQQISARPLLRKLISAQEAERIRIARELHDETSQALTSIMVGLAALRSRLPADQDDIRLKLAELQELTTDTLDGIHNLIHGLRPTLLDSLGMVEAIKCYAESHLKEVGIKSNFETTGVERRLSPEVEIAVFRIFQEAITNIIKHSGAGSVGLRLEFKGEALYLKVKDDGKGFDPNTLAGRRGLGLQGMVERADLLGGNLTVCSRPHWGTSVEAVIPVGAHTARSDE